MPTLENFTYTPSTHLFYGSKARTRALNEDRFGRIHGVPIALLRWFIQKRFVESLKLKVGKGVEE